MSALKLLVFAALITLAVAPLPILDFKDFVKTILKTDPKPWWPAWKLDSAKKGSHAFKATEHPLIPLAFLAKGVVKGVALKAGAILLLLSKLKFPATLFVAIHTLIGLSKALEVIVAAVIPGLGHIIGSIVIAASKILFCLTGHGISLTGKPAVCKSHFGKEFGCNPYTGGYKSPLDIIHHYNLGDCSDQIDKLVDKASGGKGLSGLHHSIQVIVTVVKDLGSLFHHGAKHNWVIKDLEKIVTALATILGAIGNGYSCTDGYGPDLVESIVIYLTPIFKVSGLEIACYENEINKNINGCGRYQFDGALKNCEDDKNGDDGDSSDDGGDDDGDGLDMNDGGDCNDDTANDDKENGDDDHKDDPGDDKNENDEHKGHKDCD